MRTKTIINDEAVFICKANLDWSKVVILHRQSYSDGTYFYTLKDENGHNKIEHCSDNINKLIEQLEHENKIEKDTLNKDLYQKHKIVRKTYHEVIRFTNEIIENLRLIV